jgi:hypothetical protein
MLGGNARIRGAQQQFTPCADPHIAGAISIGRVEKCDIRRNRRNQYDRIVSAIM